MPAAQPVAFHVEHDEILFRVGACSVPPAKDVVSFEADDIDPHTLDA